VDTGSGVRKSSGDTGIALRRICIEGDTDTAVKRGSSEVGTGTAVWRSSSEKCQVMQ
jgi:hypothetical protein